MENDASEPCLLSGSQVTESPYPSLPASVWSVWLSGSSALRLSPYLGLVTAKNGRHGYLHLSGLAVSRPLLQLSWSPLMEPTELQPPLPGSCLQHSLQQPPLLYADMHRPAEGWGSPPTVWSTLPLETVTKLPCHVMRHVCSHCSACLSFLGQLPSFYLPQSHPFARIPRSPDPFLPTLLILLQDTALCKPTPLPYSPWK